MQVKHNPSFSWRGILIALLVLLGIIMGYALHMLAAVCLVLSAVVLIFSHPFRTMKYYALKTLLDFPAERKPKKPESLKIRSSWVSLLELCVESPYPKTRKSFFGVDGPPLSVKRSRHQFDAELHAKVQKRQRHIRYTEPQTESYVERKIQEIQSLRLLLSAFFDLMQKHMPDVTLGSELQKTHDEFFSSKEKLLTQLGDIGVSEFFQGNKKFFEYIAIMVKLMYQPKKPNDLRSRIAEIGEGIDRVYSHYPGVSFLQCNPRRRSLSSCRYASAFRSYLSLSDAELSAEMDTGTATNASHARRTVTPLQGSVVRFLEDTLTPGGPADKNANFSK